MASDPSLARLPKRQRDEVVEALVIALLMIVRDVFTHDGSKMPLADGHDVTQALGQDRPDETLGIGVQVRASRRQAQQLHVGGCQVPLAHDELLPEQAILGDERGSSTEQIGGETGKEPSEISHGGSRTSSI